MNPQRPGPGIGPQRLKNPRVSPTPLPTPEPARHGWFRPMKRQHEELTMEAEKQEEFTMETEKAVRPNLPSLPELMRALRQGGSQVSLEKRPDVGYVVVLDGRVVATAATRIHLCMDLREWMDSTGLWP